jgi:hypothetical protein
MMSWTDPTLTLTRTGTQSLPIIDPIGVDKHAVYGSVFYGLNLRIAAERDSIALT